MMRIGFSCPAPEAPPLLVRIPLPRTRSWVNPEHEAGQASFADMRSGTL